MRIALLLGIASAIGTCRAAGDYAFFAQWTLASHKDGTQNRWPCVARLSDGRILVVWSRLLKGGEEDAIVAAFSSDCGCGWTAPEVLIANAGVVDADPSIVVSGSRVFVTCTSVSFAEGIRTSTTWCVRSEDNGATWSQPYEIAMGHRYTCGKTHRGLRLKSGTLLMGYSWDVLCEQGETLRSEGEMDLRAGVLRSTNNGDSWTNGGDTHADYDKVSSGAVRGTDEPAIVELEDGSIYMLMRTGTDHLYEARSTDEGVSWHDIQPSPLRGSNAPAALSGFERDGRRGIFAVWDNALRRFPLCAAASLDGGRIWTRPRDIGFPYTGGQASYPSCVQAGDGTLLAVWQQDVPGGRDVRLARFSPAWLLENEVAKSQETTTSVRLPKGISTKKGYAAPADLERSPEADKAAEPTRRAKIVAFGDSTTAPRGPLRVYTQLLSEDLPLHGLAAAVINAAGGGNTTAMGRARFERDVLAHEPDLVVIGFGVNDSAVDVWKGATSPRVALEDYAANLRHFVAELRKQGAHVILMTPNPLAWTPLSKEAYGKPPYDPEDPDGFNVTLKSYADAARKVAETKGVSCVDVYRMFADYARRRSIHEVLLDGMHPNDVGHRLIADKLLETIVGLLHKAT